MQTKSVGKFILVFILFITSFTIPVFASSIPQPIPIPQPLYISNALGGSITINLPNGLGNVSLILFCNDGRREPVSDTPTERGNIIFFDVVFAPETLVVPVPDDMIGKIFYLRASAPGFNGTQFIIPTNARKSIAEFGSPKPITVSPDTSSEDLPLPTRLMVTLAPDNETNWVSVAWDTANYKPVPGTYTFEGKIDTSEYSRPANVEVPPITVTVSSDAAPIALVNNTDDIIAKFAVGQKTFYINNAPYEMDVPVCYDHYGWRTLVPVRFISMALGYQVDWNNLSGEILIVGNGNEIILSTDSNIMYKNGTPIEMDSSAVIINGRTYIPARFVAEALGFQVTFDQTSGLITLTGSVN